MAGEEGGAVAHEVFGDFIVAVFEDEAEGFADGGHPEVVEDQQAADGDELVGEVEVDEDGVKEVRAVDEDEVERFFFVDEAGEDGLGGFFEKGEEVGEARAVDVVEAEVFEFGLVGVDGGVMGRGAPTTWQSGLGWTRRVASRWRYRGGPGR